MTCMTTKNKFDAVDPEVVVLRNGRYAYRVQCPWEGKHGKTLFAYKFCSSSAYQDYVSRHSIEITDTQSESRADPIHEQVSSDTESESPEIS